ncbi:hypothetical protein C8Q78DRAFT_594554 [Trametes maxima]|nr:hypothetical protein C8Q78DRAFT_594554 [Trametes maxima]
MAPTPSTDAVALGLSSAPAFSPGTLLVIGSALLLTSLCVGTAICVASGRRRPDQPKDPASHPVNLGCERYGTIDIKNDASLIALPPTALLARPRCALDSFSKLNIPGKLPLPDSCSPILAPGTSRLRDSVICRALGQLAWPSLSLRKARVEDIEAGATDKVTQSSSVDDVDPDSTVTYPEWVRPHMREIRELATREWTVYNPSARLVVPEIVIQPCDEEPVLGSPADSVSTPPSEFDTPPPMTPTLSSPVGFYLPESPSFSGRDYLQVPPASWNAPREEEKPVLRNVSNFSGRTFTLAAPPAGPSKLGKTLRERRLAKAQAAGLTDSKHQTSDSPTEVARAEVGLGLALQPQFEVGRDDALVVSTPSSGGCARRLPGLLAPPCTKDPVGEFPAEINGMLSPSGASHGYLAPLVGTPETRSSRFTRVADESNASSSFESTDSEPFKPSGMLDEYHLDALKGYRDEDACADSCIVSEAISQGFLADLAADV